MKMKNITGTFKSSSFFRVIIGLIWIYMVGQTLCHTANKKGQSSSPCRQNQKCSYRISKLVENEYNMVRIIMENLITSHWNVTLEFVNMYVDTNLRSCDHFMDNVAVDKVISLAIL